MQDRWKSVKICRAIPPSWVWRLFFFGGGKDSIWPKPRSNFRVPVTTRVYLRSAHVVTCPSLSLVHQREQCCSNQSVSSRRRTDECSQWVGGQRPPDTSELTQPPAQVRKTWRSRAPETSSISSTSVSCIIDLPRIGLEGPTMVANFLSFEFFLVLLGPFYGAIAFPPVTRCRCCRRRCRGHRTPPAL